MASTVFEVLQENLDGDIARATQHLTGGGAQDFASYKEMVGLVRGLRAAKQYVSDLSRNMEDDDD